MLIILIFRSRGIGEYDVYDKKSIKKIEFTTKFKVKLWLLENQ